MNYKKNMHMFVQICVCGNLIFLVDMSLACFGIVQSFHFSMLHLHSESNVDLLMEKALVLSCRAPVMYLVEFHP